MAMAESVARSLSARRYFILMLLAHNRVVEEGVYRVTGGGTSSNRIE